MPFRKLGYKRYKGYKKNKPSVCNGFRGAICNVVEIELCYKKVTLMLQDKILDFFSLF